ncbi:energy-coupled thiamine transporter ThiT [Brevibacillus daliensis]|uniref:energy-coupled thiamine transporter ThiT n=1 Tax=Brevibacillus daliensis TaxID=2892995 RepID=UPI001E5B0C14|nr:energy-coupled thiamine transporter ThiT [Brevibacillus daliensis]
MNRERLIVMMEIAVITALSVILSKLKIFDMPQGGSVSLVMIPLALLAFRRGIGAGMIAGFLVGLVKLILGAEILHPIQVALDYPLSYTFMGLAAFFYMRNQTKGKKIASVWIGLFISFALCWGVRVISGGYWFGHYAPEGMNPFIYSIGYNATYMIPEFIITAVIMSYMVQTAPHLFKSTATARVA